MQTNNKSLPSSLNKTALEILKIGSLSSDWVFMVVKQRGRIIVQSNGNSIEIDISIGSNKAEYDEALQQLINDRYITAVNSKQNSYQLTTKGFSEVQP